MMAVDVEIDAEFSADLPYPLFPSFGTTDYDVSLDGQRFLVRDQSGQDATVNFPITVVLNWWVDVEERLR